MILIIIRSYLRLAPAREKTAVDCMFSVHPHDSVRACFHDMKYWIAGLALKTYVRVYPQDMRAKSAVNEASGRFMPFSFFPGVAQPARLTASMSKSLASWAQPAPFSVVSAAVISYLPVHPRSWPLPGRWTFQLTTISQKRPLAFFFGVRNYVTIYFST